MADRVSGVEAGANGFLTKPPVFSELEVRIRSLLRVKHLTDGLDSAEAVMISLAEAIESRDPYTMGHCERLATYAVALGTHLGLQAAQLAALRRGGILHDIGKVAIPDAILFKPTALTPAEFAFMQRHTSIGAALCANLKSLDDVCPIIRHHHERADGSGYPDGLKGSAIPLLARIMTIVDAYDAMTTSRPYRPARTPNEAIAELWEDVARGWKDGELVAAFQKVVLATPHLPSGHQFAA
jgi:putative two-component system response regulator